jgi:rhodanese-related sulfurtransferase
MWKLLRMFCSALDGNATQQNPREPYISQISAVELASLRLRAPDQLMIFDLRESGEIEEHSYTIPGALLTINVNFEALVPWIPPDTFVVLYATAEIPVRYAGIPLLSRELRFCSLEGGLRSWREAGLPLEQLILSDRRPVDSR